MTRLLILDFDGTLADTRTNIVMTMKQTMAHLGYRVASEDEIASTIGLPLDEGFRSLLEGISEEKVEECTSTYRELFEINRKAYKPSLFPEVMDTLRRLRDAGIVLTIASSRSSRSLNAFLDEMGIRDYFAYILGADKVSHAKPHPEPVLKTLAELGFKAEETLVVGDMPVDILMGKGAGTLTCGVSYGNSSREELLSCGADHVVDRFGALIALSTL